MSDFVYGVVVDGTFYSGRMTRKLHRMTTNGIYSMDMSLDEFESSIQPADLSEASKYFRKVSRMDVIRGISFHDGIIPDNPVKYPSIPIKVIDPTYDEFEEVEVVFVKPNGYYFLRPVETEKAFTLMDLKARLASKERGNISGIKGLNPSIRIAYSLHLMEAIKKEKTEPEVAIRAMMGEVGAKVNKVVANNRGFEVHWESDGYKLITILDKLYRVINAGYCVKRNDRMLSARSVVNILKDGVKAGVGIHLTVVDDSDVDQVDDDDDW